jgi:hypothetical protein
MKHAATRPRKFIFAAVSPRNRFFRRISVAPCNDDLDFPFEKLPKGSAYSYKVTGPAGEFSARVSFRNANTGKTITLPGPPGTKKLPDAPAKTHVAAIEVVFVKECDVTVEADCNGQKYCRKIHGTPDTHPLILHILRMDKD